ASILRDRLLEAATARVPDVVAEMTPYRRWLDPLLRESYAAEANEDTRQQLHLSMALLPSDLGQVDYLYGRLLRGGVEEVVAIRAVLMPHRPKVCEPLWKELTDPKVDPNLRLRAACALAAYTPDDARWELVASDLTAKLARENASVIKRWADALHPARRFLLPPLADILKQETR